jgi:hypothetical protein
VCLHGAIPELIGYSCSWKLGRHFDSALEKLIVQTMARKL